MTPAENDIFARLLDPENPKVTQELNADSRLLVVAGRYVLILRGFNSSLEGMLK